MQILKGVHVSAIKRKIGIAVGCDEAAGVSECTECKRGRTIERERERRESNRLKRDFPLSALARGLPERARFSDPPGGKSGKLRWNPEGKIVLRAFLCHAKEISCSSRDATLVFPLLLPRSASTHTHACGMCVCSDFSFFPRREKR